MAPTNAEKFDIILQNDEINNAIDVHENKIKSISETTKRVLVTGGAGFIGFHTCLNLLLRGDFVIIVDELNDYYDVAMKESNIAYLRQRFPKSLEIVIGNVGNKNLIDEIFLIHRPDYIIHLAARAGVRPSIEDPLLYINANIHATTVLLEAARKYSCRKFVYASSSSVYGGSMKDSFSEDDVVDFPVSQYAASKKSCELLAHTYHHLYGLTCIGLRFFTVYGPRGRPDMAPFKFMDKIYHSKEIQQYGDGSSSRDYTYIDDIVNGIVLSMDKAIGYEIFNLGNGNPVFLKDFINTIEKLLGKKALIKVLPDQPGDVPRTCANVEKARKMLGYNPRISLHEGLSKTVEWYLDQQSNLD